MKAREIELRELLGLFVYSPWESCGILNPEPPGPGVIYKQDPSFRGSVILPHRTWPSEEVFAAARELLEVTTSPLLGSE